MTRRPLATRSAGWAKALARGLARTQVTPNAISMASVLFAGLACVAFWASRGVADGWLVVAATAIQLRLLCNLLDGMVAVEGGKASADGAFWNEFPDRIADVAILVGAGLAVDNPALGWAVGSVAVGTAYVREARVAQGLDADFSGPMAKPHRMAAITIAALLAIALPRIAGHATLELALWVVLIGTVLTFVRRAVRFREALSRK
ncbi:MAG: CDP-alcohol phosphatidyltransferase family protein [Maritimibacter sp.]|uniref:CDP-alcohol phosphatidyltransferase family protein n=1 Tax=Maritimibacter sp. TaxID=2003363 RepID=UPI001DF2E39B|nr:CDP-alcohol phosphatidyltransferase family protein [Maritimibacter sp.]MBL6427257.1 CDP-alcohol phosphatidyltransferase family protein [Maritimibacter sp.]